MELLVVAAAMKMLDLMIQVSRKTIIMIISKDLENDRNPKVYFKCQVCK
jgi:hypothetical protein